MKSQLISMSQADNSVSLQKVINWIQRHLIEIYLYKRVGLEYTINCFKMFPKSLIIFHRNVFDTHKINAVIYNVKTLKGPHSLWSSDAIRQHRSRSTLAQVMACCLVTPSHYLNQCWLLINELKCHSPEINLTASARPISQYNEFENYTF